MTSEFIKDNGFKKSTEFGSCSEAKLKLLDDMYKDWKKSHFQVTSTPMDFMPMKGANSYEPFDFEIDSGFYGGREKIRERYLNEATLEHRLLQGDTYDAAREAAGMTGPYFPGQEIETRTQAKYNQALREGKGYQEARMAAGMRRDCDPGFAGGEAKILWRDRAFAWLKEYLRQGKDLSTAESMALEKIGPSPKR